MKSLIALVVVFLVFICVGTVDAHAATMLVRQGKVSGNYYGGASWGTMTTNLSNYDAVWVDAANGSDTLSATEVSKLQAFAATGKRVFLIGENAGWTVWDNSILSVVGDSFDAQAASTTYAPAITHPLTNGI